MSKKKEIATIVHKNTTGEEAFRATAMSMLGDLTPLQIRALRPVDAYLTDAEGNEKVIAMGVPAKEASQAVVATLDGLGLELPKAVSKMFSTEGANVQIKGDNGASISIRRCTSDDAWLMAIENLELQAGRNAISAQKKAEKLLTAGA